VQQQRGERDVHDEAQHDGAVVSGDDADALQGVAEEGVRGDERDAAEDRARARGVHRERDRSRGARVVG
jgi:hypothetical protein